MWCDKRSNVTTPSVNVKTTPILQSFTGFCLAWDKNSHDLSNRNFRIEVLVPDNSIWLKVHALTELFWPCKRDLYDSRQGVYVYESSLTCVANHETVFFCVCSCVVMGLTYYVQWWRVSRPLPRSRHPSTTHLHCKAASSPAHTGAFCVWRPLVDDTNKA